MEDRTNPDTYQTLIDLVIEKNDYVRRQYMKDIGLYEDEAILKRNADLTTLLDECLENEDTKLAEIFSSHFKDCENIPKARDILMKKVI